MKKRIEAIRHPVCSCGLTVTPRWAGVEHDIDGCIVARNRDGIARKCNRERQHECDTCGYSGMMARGKK